MLEFRKESPIRTYKGSVKNNYRDYREHLRSDFNFRCGYSDISEKFLFDTSLFHIDHFRPKARDKFPHLETDYSNLVYSSCYINRSKKDDWHGDDVVSEIDGKGYLDPCDVDYNEHFSRKADGSIVPHQESAIANYMYVRLKLYLKRYSLLWMMEKIDSKLDKIEQKIELLADNNASAEKVNNLKVLHSDLCREFRKNLKILHISIHGS